MQKYKKQQIIDSYNNHAEGFAKKFDALGARTDDILNAIKIVGKENPRVLEIGCGNGRDAHEILKYTTDYLGIDISKELIRLAIEKNLNGQFEIVDVEDFIFPKEIDIVFAFASLIHIDKEPLKYVFNRVYDSLNKGGIFVLSMKNGEKYQEINKEDEFGIRTRYLYSGSDLKDLDRRFTVIKEGVEEKVGSRWLEIVFKK